MYIKCDPLKIKMTCYIVNVINEFKTKIIMGQINEFYHLNMSKYLA